MNEVAVDPMEAPFAELPRSWTLRQRYVVALSFAGAITITAFALSLTIGPREISLREVLESIVRYNATNDAHLVARDIRLPRALLALIVGGSLGAAGAMMQGVTRNPLAGPTIMGLSGGGTLAILIALIAAPGLSYNGSIVASFVGATMGYGCVLAVACLSPDGFTPARLALAGAVTSALLAAITQGLIICYAMAGDMLYWTAGGIATVTWSQVVAVLPVCVVGLAGAIAMAPSITLLSLGNDVAVGLGARAAWLRTGATLAVLLLTGSAVAVAGPVAFVGLMVPHLCRLFVGADYRRLVPLATVVGAGLTEAADLAARTILNAGREVPLGMVTAVLGAPCFVWLVRARSKYRLEAGVPMKTVAREHWPAWRVLVVLLALLVAMFVLAIHMGYAPVSPAELFKTISGYGSGGEQLVLFSFRLPRVIFAMLVGAGIAISGAMLQGVLRNDLAEPGLLGVSAGASLAIVLSLCFLGYAVLNSIFLLPAMAIVGALGAMLFVGWLSLGGPHSPTRLMLTGVAVSSALGALSILISLRMSSQAYAFSVAFSAGSMSVADWNYVVALSVWLAVLAPLAWSCAATMNVLQLGHDPATGLGVTVTYWSLVLLAVSVAICAACMALAGGMMFLGLIAPHIARRLVGADHTVVLPAAALVGAMLLVLADMLGSHIVPSAEIPAGVMVSALGAPYFLFLLTRP